MCSVVVCGSRGLPFSGIQLVASLVGSLLKHQRPLVVGCASGADRAALDMALFMAPSLVSVLAAFGPSGSGSAGPASAVSTVQAAARAGVPVTWWAGGGPSVPLRARLAARSLAAVRRGADSGPGAGLVAVVGAFPSRTWSGRGPWRSCGSGSWSSVAAAAALGVKASVFPVGELAGCSCADLPALPSGPGRWVAAGSGIWDSGWVWVPAKGLL